MSYNHLFYIETLGCPRNDSDSEVIIKNLTQSGYYITENPQKASIIILNTCAFIQKAVSRSIQRTLELKNANPDCCFVLTGCLPQRYEYEIQQELPEVDLLIGTGDIDRITEILDDKKSIISNKKGYTGKNVYKKNHTTPAHYRYLKIGEGCNSNCTFCLIPELKGKLHSKSLDDIKEEVLSVPEETRELILVAQDTSSWGLDLYNKPSLDRLLKEISPLFPCWIRILYLNPLTVNEKLLKTINELPNIVNYLHIPIQHISTSVLDKMGRGYSSKYIYNLLEKIKNTGEFCIRTTLMIGFPSETERDFSELIDFVKKEKISRAGVFKYSPEEGTPSCNLDNIDSDTVHRRYLKLTDILQKNRKNLNEKLTGTRLTVLIDNKQEGEYYGRTIMDAPEIDQVVWVEGDELKTGKFYRVEIDSALESELFGHIA